MRVIGLIPARGGSKGIPRKNLKPLGGKPLIQWTVESARAAKCLDRIILSTEDREIAEAAEHLGVEVMSRPHEFARDDTPMAFVMRHALEELKWQPEALVLLQPTSPFRRASLIDEAVAKLDTYCCKSVFSFASIPRHMGPEYAWMVAGESRKAVPLMRQATVRQKSIQAYYRDGGVYVFRVEVLRNGEDVYKDCMPVFVTRDEACTLDEPEDWDEAERRVAAVALKDRIESIATRG